MFLLFYYYLKCISFVENQTVDSLMVWFLMGIFFSLLQLRWEMSFCRVHGQSWKASKEAWFEASHWWGTYFQCISCESNFLSTLYRYMHIERYTSMHIDIHIWAKIVPTDLWRELFPIFCYFEISSSPFLFCLKQPKFKSGNLKIRAN